MASLEASTPVRDPVRSRSPDSQPSETQAASSQQLRSTPIEMNSLRTSDQPGHERMSAMGQSSVQANTGPKTAVSNENDYIENSIASNFLAYDAQHREPSPAALANSTPADAQPQHSRLTRTETAPAIGPATDRPSPLIQEASEGPVLFITLLLASTGARHPYKLDSKYLQKRQVEVEGDNPINMSLYKLKELILRDWRSEWDAKPSSPESIRLIFMGKMLNDKSRLADNGFTNSPTPQIVHMAIKPQEIVDEEEANKATGKDRDGNDRSTGCRCVIQ